MNVRILIGDCRESLRRLPSGSVQCVVTSPPYFGLRDYGHAGQIGLEPTPDEFVAAMVEVFREVRRVLRDDGTLWLNLGDSYASNQSSNGGYSEKSTLAGFTRPDTKGRRANESLVARKIDHGAKPKDLLMIPARVALALQADGWWLRSEIIWNKPNPMPESVTDRPTKSHEKIFLMSKSERYFYDAEAVKEPGVIPAGTLGAKGSAERQSQEGVNARPPEYKVYDGTRNLRDVWTITTKPFSGAHFATFPPEIPERCIKAGSKPGDLILDPFGGAGTTGLVAAKMGRSAILCELNPAYADMARARITDDLGAMFTKVTTEAAA